MKNKVFLGAVIVALLVIAFLFSRAEFILSVSVIGAALRWLIIALIAAIAAKRRSLTSWILVGLLAGAEVGHDFPQIAANLQFLGAIFLILFAMALALVPEPKRRPMLALAESLSETMFKFTNIVMLAAPIGVFGAVAYTVGHLGLGILLPLLKLLATMYVALAVFITCVLFPIALIARVPIKKFLAAAAEPVTIAFATASSEAALPRAMEEMESLGVPRETVAFVLPTGYSFNLDGSSLYQSLALIFIAQAAGIHLTITQQALMLLTLLISSKGTAGVARASLVIVLAAATSFHLPTEPLFLLFAIDQLMDMGRTAVNVLGNCLATVVIARWEHEFPTQQSASPQT